MSGHELFQNNVHDELSNILFGYRNHSFYYQILSCIPDGYYCWKCDLREVRGLLWKSPDLRGNLHHLTNYDLPTKFAVKQMCATKFSFPIDCQLTHKDTCVPKINKITQECSKLLQFA